MRAGIEAFAMLLSSVAASSASPALAQDASRGDSLAPVVVTAERSAASLTTVSAAVTRITREQIATLPHATLADVLRLVPGFAIVDFDGVGRDPQLMVRGFYGGGEAEYVTVLVDGRAVSRLESGLVTWDVLPPLESIDAIEVVRGGASALWGDAAIGAVVNIRTRMRGGSRDIPPAVSSRAGDAIGEGSTVRQSLAVASHGGVSANLDAPGRLLGRDASLVLALDRTSGFRAHAGRRTGHLRGSMDVLRRDDARLSVAVRGHWRDIEEPGALLETLVTADRRQSDPLFRFDRTRDDAQGLSLDAERRLGSGARASGSFAMERRDVSAIRALALAPGFGDTKERELASTRAHVQTQVNVVDSPLPGADILVIGVEAATGRVDSRYFDIASGDRDAYAASSGARGSLDAAGAGSRTAGAAFAHYALNATDALRLSLAARVDFLRDAYAPTAPSADRFTARHTAFSPKAGLNLRYLEGPKASGHVFATVGRAFKAPTPDQLFDQRSIPLPEPPFSATTSNPLLQPQYGTSIEGGVYHLVEWNRVRAAASLSVYQTDMKDELDFDVATLRYVNIGRSRHRGAESSLSLTTATASFFANYTAQFVEARSGANAGRTLKAIPRHVVVVGTTYQPVPWLQAGASVLRLHRMYLDDANTRTIPAWSRVDARLGWRWRSVRIELEARNVLDARYVTTGFADPAGTGEAYFHPAAGRTVTLGVRHGW